VFLSSCRPGDFECDLPKITAPSGGIETILRKEEPRPFLREARGVNAPISRRLGKVEPAAA